MTSNAQEPAGGERDLRLPDHRQRTADRLPAPLRALTGAATAIGVTVIGVIYLIGAPLVAIATGIGQIAMEIRDTAVRPRPFVGAHHGFPFLDPRAPAGQPAVDDEQEN